MKQGFFKKYNSRTLGGLLLNMFVAFSLVMLLCLFYFYIYLPGVTNHGETITVPNVEGMAVEKVASFLEEHDLRFEINDSSYSSDYPPLTVLKQVPASGAKVKENRKIYLSINRVTPPTVPMPDLIDGSLINAEAVLRGSELRRGKIDLVRGPFLNVVKEMKVKGRTIAPNTRIPKGTIIDLVVMDGGSPYLPMPDVIGMELEDAKIPLLGSNLSIGQIHVAGDTSNGNNLIIKQKPEAQENIRVGDVVELWIGLMDENPEDNEEPTDDADNTDL